MKILLAKRRALGDTVLLSSTVELLRTSLPEAEISVLVPGAFAPVLEGNPGIREILRYEDGFFPLLKKLRSRRFDYFLQLHSSPGNRWLARAAGARRVHFHAQNAQTETAYGKHPNALEWDGFFLRTLFGEKVKLPAPLPRIFLSETERQEGKDYWVRMGADPGRVVFLGLGASRPTKRWLPAHFAELAEMLRDRLGAVPALITGPGEEEETFSGQVINELRARGLRPLSGPGDKKGSFVHGAGLSVRDLAKALSAVKAYAGNDSGPKHMAVALGVPTLTTFGPEDPVEWHPYDRVKHPVFFLAGLECRKEDNGRWCGIQACELSSLERHRCMADIRPHEVYGVIEKVWRASP